MLVPVYDRSLPYNTCDSPISILVRLFFLTRIFLTHLTALISWTIPSQFCLIKLKEWISIIYIQGFSRSVDLSLAQRDIIIQYRHSITLCQTPVQVYQSLFTQSRTPKLFKPEFKPHLSYNRIFHEETTPQSGVRRPQRAEVPQTNPPIRSHWEALVPEEQPVHAEAAPEEVGICDGGDFSVYEVL